MHIESAQKSAPSREKVWQMFDRIAHRYDLLNHLLSAGQDIRWRKKLKNYIPKRESVKLLDVATGTGDQLFSLIKFLSDTITFGEIENTLLYIWYISSAVISKMFSLPKKSPSH